MKDKLHDLLKDIWNVPNVLTMIRLIMVPVFAVMLMTGHSMQALVVFCLASLTDALDGYIARTCNLITSFGKLMDPLADKLLIVTAIVCQGIRGVFPWVAIVLVIIKEIWLVCGSFMMLKRNIVVQATMVGKVSTCFFMAALIASFFHDQLMGWWPLDAVLFWIGTVLTLIAGVYYTVAGMNKVRAAQ